MNPQQEQMSERLENVLKQLAAVSKDIDAALCYYLDNATKINGGTCELLLCQLREIQEEIAYQAVYVDSISIV
ncbi:hypothetical protein [Mobiluncus mulieris]|uniref:hypothetical protein n=1 Tax=Mobiluncus mulieris TaxID=2052 RepID=UPI001470786A|nr:hypothetical protein [Mobiluncus mulieris]NMX11141.1 hypothetical protein [Mobiluncus mulieris]